MADHTPVSVEPQQIERAQNMWIAVTNVAKWSVIAVAVVLLGLLLFVY